MSSEHAYQPMAEDEVYCLIKAAQNGDFSAKEQLVTNNLALVHSIVRRFTEL